jgi:hypothetical protein
MNNIDIIALITLAFVSSLTHCIGMCGGFVTAYSTTKLEHNNNKYQNFVYHLMYNSGRVTTYALIGAIFGYLGSVIMINVKMAGYLYILIGAFMILMGLSMIGKIKFLNSITLPNFMRDIFKKLIQSKSKFSFFALGSMNGFIPCGLVYFFAATAAGSGSVIDGMTIMILFGISTIPALLSFGYMVSYTSSIRAGLFKFGAFIMILYSFYMFYKGYLFIFDNNTSFNSCH